MGVVVLTVSSPLPLPARKQYLRFAIVLTSTMSSGTHIRPKVRRSGGNSAPVAAETTNNPATTPADNAAGTAAALPKGILRKPKYGQIEGQIEKPSLQDLGPQQQQQSTWEDEEAGHTKVSAAPLVVRGTVMERPRTKRNRSKGKATAVVASPGEVKKASVSIEGYTPRHDVAPKDSTTTPANAAVGNSKPRTKEEEALVLNSLAELMETTGINLPDSKTPVSEAAAVEADLEFSVMAPEDFNEYKEEQRQAQYEVFLGKPSVFQQSHETDKENSVQEDADDHENVLDDDDSNNDEDDDDEGIMDDYFDNDSDDDDEVIIREPRAFMKLWSALSQWITPEAVAFVQSLRKCSADDSVAMPDIQSAVDRSDLGASRCAGLMVMVQMHIRSALEELGRDLEERRNTERLVGDLLRTFDYGRPSPKLDVAQSKAMATILLQTILYKPETNNNDPAAAPMKVPTSCQNVGLNADEFRYLTVSAICNLATPSG